MIVREEYMTLKSGKKLYRMYSDRYVRIIQIPSGLIFDDAVDPEGSAFTYAETEIPIEKDGTPTE